MDLIQAKEILEALADGVNTATGELLSKYDSRWRLICPN